MFWNFLKKQSINRTLPTKAVKGIQQANISLNFLQELIPIGNLPVEKLRSIQTTMRHFQAGEIIFTRGDQSDTLPYLQHGEIFLETGNGGGYFVEASTFKACYPLSTESEHKFSAFAKTPTCIIYLPRNALRESNEYINNPLIKMENVPQELQSCDFFMKLCSAYRNDTLRVPSLPDVALRLQNALRKDVSITEATKIVNLDPVLSSKLIRVVNSPMYGTLSPATNCFEAVNRLGLKTTQNLATSISLNNLFISTDKYLHEKIQTAWKQSIHVASLSHTLATVSGRFDPDEALLAGLIHNIGCLPIITFAQSQGRVYYSELQLEQSMVTLQGLLGTSMLKKWHFPSTLQQIPLLSTNWYYDDSEDLQLNDIVLLAKFHNELGNPNKQKLPPLNTLPAFHKLGQDTLTPDTSLQILHDAKHQIAETLKFFK